MATDLEVVVVVVVVVVVEVKVDVEVVGLERVHLTSWVQLGSYLKEKVAAPV
jgi:hypothetical protein